MRLCWSLAASSFVPFFAAVVGAGGLTDAVPAQCLPVVEPGGNPPGGGFTAQVTGVTKRRNGDIVAVSADGVRRWNGQNWAAVGLFPITVLPQDVTEMPNGDLIVAGSNLFVFGGVFRWNGASWLPLNSPETVAFVAHTRPNGEVAIGGQSGVFLWNGINWAIPGGGVFGVVRALASLPNGDLVVGGTFAFAGITAAANIARWDGTAWHALGTGVSGGAVDSMVVTANGDLVAGGAFTTAGGVAARGIARWNGVAWQAVGGGMSALANVSALTLLPDGDLVAAGSFTSAGGVLANNLARWDGTTWSAFTVGANDAVHALTWLPSGRLVLGGKFTAVGGVTAPYFARVASTCPASAQTQSAGCAGSGGSNALTVTDLPWVDGVFRAEGTGLPLNALVLVLTSVTPVVPGLPLASVLPQGVPGCNLHVMPDILGLELAVAGTAQSQLLLPGTPPILGVTFYHQMIPFELDLQGTILAITATNSVAATVGAF